MALRRWTVLMCGLALCALAATAFAQGPGADSEGPGLLLYFPLRNGGFEPDRATILSGSLLTALHAMTGQATIEWEPDRNVSVLRAIAENRITQQDVDAWTRTAPDDRDAPAKAMALARALMHIGRCVWGTVSPAGGGVKYRLYVMDIPYDIFSPALEVEVPEGGTTDTVARAALSELDRIHAWAAEQAGPPAGPPEVLPGNPDDPPNNPENTWIASADPQAEELYGQAIEKALAHDPEGALALLNKAARIDPNSSLIYLEKGRAHRRLGQEEDAIGALKIALELDPNNPVIAAELADLEDHPTLVGPLQNSEGLERLEAMVNANPEDIDLRTRLAEWYERDKSYGKALRQYQELQSLLVQDTRVQAKIGEMCLELNDLENAENAFEQLLLWEPGNRDAHEALGRLKAQAGDLEASFEHFAKASRAWVPGYLMESPRYYALINAIDNALEGALQDTRDPILMLRDTLFRDQPEAQSELRREEYYEATEAARDTAQAVGGMLDKVDPPRSAREMHGRFNTSAKLAVQAFVNLLGALDANDADKLDTAQWARDEAVKDFEAARELHEELRERFGGAV